MYVGIVFLVVVNMFISIVTKYFDEVHEEVQRSDGWQRGARSWEMDMLFHIRRYSRLGSRRLQRGIESVRAWFGGTISANTQPVEHRDWSLGARSRRRSSTTSDRSSSSIRMNFRAGDIDEEVEDYMKLQRFVPGLLSIIMIEMSTFGQVEQ